jgi:hypothetical protein
MIEGRARISDEQWVDMGDDLSDSQYNDQYKTYFNIEL